MSREYPPRPIVGIGIVVLRPGAVLVTRRGHPPNEGSWALPGGAQKLGETAEEAARRELREETGLEVGPMQLAGQVDSITRDADGRVHYHYTIIDFAAAWTGGIAWPGSDATASRWVAFSEVRDALAWTEAQRIVSNARAMLDY